MTAARLNDQPVELRRRLRPVARRQALSGDPKRHQAFRHRSRALDDVSLDVYRASSSRSSAPRVAARPRCCARSPGSMSRRTGTIGQAGREFPPAGRRARFRHRLPVLCAVSQSNVRDNVAYGLVSEGLPRAEIERRVERAAGAGRSARAGPEISRAALGRAAAAGGAGRALALSPGLLLLDEPLSALDARVRARLRGEIRDLQRRLGITTIMVTHDQEEALTMSDRIVGDEPRPDRTGRHARRDLWPAGHAVRR